MAQPRIWSKKVTSSPLNALSPNSCANGAGFRLVPLKGQASYPRTVTMGNGEQVTVTGPDWIPMPTGGSITIPCPYYSGTSFFDVDGGSWTIAIPATTIIAPGTVYAPIPELWRLDVADHLDAMVSDAGLSPMQLLYTSSSGVAWGAGQLSALIDSSPWVGLSWSIYAVSGSSTSITLYDWSTLGTNDSASAGPNFSTVNSPKQLRAMQRRDAGANTSNFGVGQISNIFDRYIAMWCNPSASPVLQVEVWGHRQ